MHIMVSSLRTAPTLLIKTVADAFMMRPGGWSGQMCPSPQRAAAIPPIRVSGEPSLTMPPWTHGSIFLAASKHIAHLAGQQLILTFGPPLMTTSPPVERIVMFPLASSVILGPSKIMVASPVVYESFLSLILKFVGGMEGGGSFGWAMVRLCFTPTRLVLFAAITAERFAPTTIVR